MTLKSRFYTCLLSFLLFAATLYAQTDMSFPLPLPPGGNLIDSKDLRWGGRLVQTFLYNSNKDMEQLLKYYRDFFKSRDFRQIMDKGNEAGGRFLRFQKEDLVVTINLKPLADKTQIVAAKFLQPAGTPPPEEIKPSVKDGLFTLPAKDFPGRDLAFIPRPPDSVRLFNNANTFIYTTKLPLPEAVRFYQAQMVAKGWQESNQVATRDAVTAYKKNTGKKTLGVESPFSDGENLEQVIQDSYMLFFTSIYGQAEITVMPNFMDRKAGSMIQVSYKKTP